jgi:exodeoxyribonuclease-5
MNRKMRKLLKLDPDTPVVNDKLICIKNDHDIGIFNGGMFTIEQILTQKYKTNFTHMRLGRIDEEGLPVLVKVHKSFFFDDVPKPDWRILKNSQEFDYGYCITCHKSQGSQWGSVLIQDESWCFKDVWERWLYTAITRASDKVKIVRN